MQKIKFGELLPGQKFFLGHDLCLRIKDFYKDIDNVQSYEEALMSYVVANYVNLSRLEIGKLYSDKQVELINED